MATLFALSVFQWFLNTRCKEKQTFVQTGSFITNLVCCQQNNEAKCSYRPSVSNFILKPCSKNLVPAMFSLPCQSAVAFLAKGLTSAIPSAPLNFLLSRVKSIFCQKTVENCQIWIFGDKLFKIEFYLERRLIEEFGSEYCPSLISPHVFKIFI